MSGLPPGTLGDAVGVLIYTFICLLTDLLLIWLLWVHHERLGCELSPLNLEFKFFQTFPMLSCLASSPFSTDHKRICCFREDVAIIAYFTQICTISSIMQQIYHYTYGNSYSLCCCRSARSRSPRLTWLTPCRHYKDIMWAQLHYIKANYPNAEVIFKNGNFGFMLVLSNIRKLELNTLWLEDLCLSSLGKPGRGPRMMVCNATLWFCSS